MARADRKPRAEEMEVTGDDGQEDERDAAQNSDTSSTAFTEERSAGDSTGRDKRATAEDLDATLHAHRDDEHGEVF